MSDDPIRPVGRDLGLDAFRGLTVLLMILVNLQGDSGAGFSLLRHADWDGLTLADLVFPWFILAVGLSTALAFGPASSRAVGPILRRTAILFALGVLLGWLIRPTFDPDAVRWAGVLQRIAIVYLACALVAQRSHGPAAPLAFGIGCLVLHSLGLLFMTAPGEAAPSLSPGQGFSGWLDQTLLPGRVHRETWDPEGVWSTLSAIGTGLLGVALARLSDRIAACTAVAMLIAGLALTPWLPLNKPLWTASYALVAGASGLGLLLLLRQAVVAGWARRLSALLIFAGQTALTVYVVHMLLIAVLVRSPFGDSLWSLAYASVRRTGLSAETGSLAFAVLATALVLAPIPWLRRRGWLIRA